MADIIKRKRKTINITYPREGGQVTLQKGVTEFNFIEGEVTTPDGETTTALSGTLKRCCEEYVRSLKILCDNDIVIWGQAAGVKVLGKFTYKALSQVPLYNQTIRRLFVDAPVNTDFSIIASTHPRAFGTGGTPYSRVYTFVDDTISASTNGNSFQVNEYKEATIFVDIKEINPSDVAGGGNTKLNADTAVDAKTINVDSETGFAADDYAYLGTNAAGDRELVKIKSTSSGQLTLYYGMVYAHSSGDSIVECDEQYLKPQVQISPDDSIFVHRASIIDTNREGDLERLTGPRAEESGLFAIGTYQAQIEGHLGKYIRVVHTMTSGGSGTFKVKSVGNFVSGV